MPTAEAFTIRLETPGQDICAHRNRNVRGQPGALFLALGSARALGRSRVWRAGLRMTPRWDMQSTALGVAQAQKICERSGKYTPEAMPEIVSGVYEDESYMVPYMWAAILIYAFWPSMIGHLALLRDQFLKRLPADAEVLELASGHGVLSLLAAEERHDIRVDGFDISPPAVAVADRLLGRSRQTRLCAAHAEYEAAITRLCRLLNRLPPDIAHRTLRPIRGVGGDREIPGSRRKACDFITGRRCTAHHDGLRQ